MRLGRGLQFGCEGGRGQSGVHGPDHRSRLLARCQLLRSASDEVVREVRDFAQGAAGQVALGSGPIAAEHLVPALSHAVLAQAPQVRIDVSVGPSWELRSQLRQGKLDLLVGLAMDSDPELVSHPLVEDVVVAADPAHPLFRLPRIQLPALLDHGWALPSVHIPSRQWLDVAFSSRGLPAPDVQLASGSIALLPRMVAGTALLSFVSRHTLALPGRPALREVKLQATTLRRSLGVTHRSTGYLSPAAQRVLSLLKQRGKVLFAAAASPTRIQPRKPHS